MDNYTNELEIEITAFKAKIYEKFGIKPLVYYSIPEYVPNRYLVTLTEFKNIAENQLPGVWVKGRKRKAVRIRQIIYTLAKLYEHGIVEIANYYNVNHATVMHSHKAIRNLLETKDEQTTTLYTMILYDVKQRANTPRIIQPINSEEINSESILCINLQTGENQSGESDKSIT